MADVSGIAVHFYTSVKELQNAKSGSSTLVGSRVKTKDYDIHVSTALEGCDFLDSEVRVNLTLIRSNSESIGKVVGEAIAGEMRKLVAEL